MVLSALILQFFLLACLVKDDVTLSGNESSRFATVESLVEKRTFAIEDSMFETVDRVKIGDQFYSNKPLLLSVFLSALYAPLHYLGGLNFTDSYHWLIAFLTLLGVTSFSVLLTFLFQKRLRSIGMPSLASILLGLAVVFTTWILSYGTSLNNHTPAAALLFAFLYLLDRETKDPKGTQALAAGVVVGLLVGIEIPTGGIFFLVGIITILCARRPVAWRSIIHYMMGFSFVTLALAALNYAAYGYPLDAYLIPSAFDFEESIHAPGIAGLRRPTHLGYYLFHITLGKRGFWSHMPVLVLGLVYLLKRRRSLPIIEKITAAAVLILFLFYGTQTGILGGWAYGFRFFIPLIPIFFWWTSLWLFESRGNKIKKLLVVFLLFIGLVTSWVGTLNPWPVAYEDAATPPTAVEAKIRSPFLSNLMVWSFQHNPDGPIFRWLAEDLYGRDTSLEYLWKEFLNRKQPDKLKDIKKLAKKWQSS